MFSQDTTKGKLESVVDWCFVRNITNVSLVAKIDAVQAEYSAFETLHETDELISTARELGVAYVAYSPLGHGWLVDDFPFQSPDDFPEGDSRRRCKSHQQLLPCPYN